MFIISTVEVSRPQASQGEVLLQERENKKRSFFDIGFFYNYIIYVIDIGSLKALAIKKLKLVSLYVCSNSF